MVAIDVMDGRQPISAGTGVLPQPERDGQHRQRAKQGDPSQFDAAEEEPSGEQRHVEPPVVAHQAGRGEQDRGSGKAVGQEQIDGAEQQCEERRLARGGGAGLEVQGRQREAERRDEGRLPAQEARRDPEEQPHPENAAQQREDARRPEPVRPEVEYSTQQAQMQGAELVRFREAAPQVRRPGPALGDLHPDRAVAVMLHPQDERRQPGCRGESQGKPQKATLGHRRFDHSQ